VKIPKIRDANALDGLFALGLSGAGAGLIWGLGWGFLVPGALLFLSVFVDDLRRGSR
jgi:hypothetical protein